MLQAILNCSFHVSGRTLVATVLSSAYSTSRIPHSLPCIKIPFIYLEFIFDNDIKQLSSTLSPHQQSKNLRSKTHTQNMSSPIMMIQYPIFAHCNLVLNIGAPTEKANDSPTVPVSQKNKALKPTCLFPMSKKRLPLYRSYIYVSLELLTIHLKRTFHTLFIPFHFSNNAMYFRGFHFYRFPKYDFSHATHGYCIVLKFINFI